MNYLSLKPRLMAQVFEEEASCFIPRSSVRSPQALPPISWVQISWYW